MQVFASMGHCPSRFTASAVAYGTACVVSGTRPHAGQCRLYANIGPVRRARASSTGRGRMQVSAGLRQHRADAVRVSGFRTERPRTVASALISIVRYSADVCRSEGRGSRLDASRGVSNIYDTVPMFSGFGSCIVVVPDPYRPNRCR